MADMDLPGLNVQKAQALFAWLATRGDESPEDAGRLSADLSDLYAGASHYQRLVDAILSANGADRVHVGEWLSDLYEAMRHLHHHIESSLDRVDALAERFD